MDIFEKYLKNEINNLKRSEQIFPDSQEIKIYKIQYEKLEEVLKNYKEIKSDPYLQKFNK